MHAEFVEQVLALDQHVDQMRHRRALIATDISHTRLQDRLGDGEDALAPKHLAFAQTERAHFLRERALGIGALGEGSLAATQAASVARARRARAAPWIALGAGALAAGGTALWWDGARISDDLHAVQEALGGLDPELRAFFYLPLLRRADKRRVLDMTFEGKVSRPVLGLFHVLVQKRRELLLDDIVEEFDHYRDDYEGRVRATVITARKLDADLATALRDVLEQRTRKTVVLNQLIDPEAIGGIRVNLGDFVLDGTIRRALSDMRRSLVAPYERG